MRCTGQSRSMFPTKHRRRLQEHASHRAGEIPTGPLGLYSCSTWNSLTHASPMPLAQSCSFAGPSVAPGIRRRPHRRVFHVEHWLCPCDKCDGWNKRLIGPSKGSRERLTKTSIRMRTSPRCRDAPRGTFKLVAQPKPVPTPVMTHRAVTGSIEKQSTSTTA